MLTINWITTTLARSAKQVFSSRRNQALILLQHVLVSVNAIFLWKLALLVRDASWQLEGAMSGAEKLLWFLFFSCLWVNGVFFPLWFLIGGVGLVRQEGQCGEKAISDDNPLQGRN